MLKSLKVGDVVLLERQYSPKSLFTKKFLKYIYELAIIYYQSGRFPDHRGFADCTHCLVYCGFDSLFEVTDPKARFTSTEELEQHITKTGRKYRIMRYKLHTFNQSTDRLILLDTANAMEGEPYAFIDIVPFILEKMMGFLPNTYKLVVNIFGNGWKKFMFKAIAGSNDIFLCSTGVAAIYATMDKETGGRIPRPFRYVGLDECEFIEMVTPAHFGCWGDFEEVPDAE